MRDDFFVLRTYRGREKKTAIINFLLELTPLLELTNLVFKDTFVPNCANHQLNIVSPTFRLSYVSGIDTRIFKYVYANTYVYCIYIY